jgi:hypothetical protein
MQLGVKVMQAVPEGIKRIRPSVASLREEGDH